jgi:hypothetical protein
MRLNSDGSLPMWLDETGRPQPTNEALAVLEGGTASVGPEGPPGERGEQGLQGPPGEDGANGSPGVQGERGEQGLKGDKGDKGDTGDTGPAGADGTGGVPAGVIVMWGGLVANIPQGWALCNGQNGTPDLRDRFVKGASAEPGTTGGAATHTHAAHSGVINHTHGVTVTDPGHFHNQTRLPTATGGVTGFTVDTSMSGTPATSGVETGSKTTGISATTANPAGGVASLTHDSPNHEPPFYLLAFIQKV